MLLGASPGSSPGGNSTPGSVRGGVFRISGLGGPTGSKHTDPTPNSVSDISPASLGKSSSAFAGT